MLRTPADLIATAKSIYGSAVPQKWIRALEILPRISADNVAALAREVRSTRQNLLRIANATDRVEAAFGAPLSAGSDAGSLKGLRLTLGNLVIGRLAERAFEKIYKDEMGNDELRLRDDRSDRNLTDYRVLNGGGRPVFRINIKFFGSQFREARKLVGLDPADCFALATYKIYQGLQKQQEEQVSYVFVIVGVPDLTSASVGEVIPEDMAHFSSFIHPAPRAQGKRSVEEAIVERLIRDDQPETTIRSAVEGYSQRLAKADWNIISAIRADRLLREMLFDRVYGVRVPRFARNYGGAELDMHFSLKNDLTPLHKFLETLRTGGSTKVVHMFGAGIM